MTFENDDDGLERIASMHDLVRAARSRMDAKLGTSTTLARCSVCDVVKPVAEFTVDKTKARGRRSDCRTCHAKKAAQAREKRRLERMQRGESVLNKHRASGATMSIEDERIIVEAHTAASEQERQVRLRVRPRSPEELAAEQAERARSWAEHRAHTAPDVVAARLAEYRDDMLATIKTHAARLDVLHAKEDVSPDEMRTLVERSRSASETYLAHRIAWTLRWRARIAERYGAQVAEALFPREGQIENLVAA